MIAVISSGLAHTFRLALFALVGLGLFLLPRFPFLGGNSSAGTEFHFHHDHILGTSLDLVVCTTKPGDADKFEQAVLDEIERLRRLLSTYDPSTDISRLNRESGPVACSAELIEVLREYEAWGLRSQGALSGHLGELIRTWKEAEKIGTEPDAQTLVPIVAQLRQPGWRIDDRKQTITRLTAQPLNINAIGRGYILGKAAAAGRAQVPQVRGFLLDIGGDMVAWGTSASGPGWSVGIADPLRPADNAAPLTRLSLRNSAIATSGPYQRFYTFGGKRYSHIFDPRTGRPAEGILSATVIAPDTVTANALATTLCVVGPQEGLRLLAGIPGAECLLIMADGTQVRSPGLARLENPLPPLTESLISADNPWPKEYELTVTLNLTNLTTAKKYRRPYVAVWLENEEGKAVRTLTVWGNQPRYQKDLNYWWKVAQNDKTLIKSVTRATRPPGQYQLTWDGANDKGAQVEQGTYTVYIEVHREHGKHIRQIGEIKCGADKASKTLAKTAETEEAKLEYGPRGK